MNPRFSHEKLDVYRLELDFVRWSTVLLNELKSGDGPCTGEVRNQLDRAGLSMLLNTAEGNGRRRMPMRAKFFDDARGSAAECAACLDALAVKGAVPAERVEDGKVLLASIAAMLSKLVAYFSETRLIREDRAEYGAGAGGGNEGEEEREKEEGEAKP
ncbi:MAG TPA: four helix bundle protein [Kiritimatiellia bacterium]|nr:four helix bundle protein [Kiritimatiellia bacterium]HRZ13198.1 four helix bundle protein [Kiritimatiellia bacterium]HSA19765.1 four helix bundle protein [Kiritimatiellia bacterium]